MLKGRCATGRDRDSRTGHGAGTRIGQLAEYVYVDTATSDIGGYADQAKAAVATHVKLPAGCTLLWTGQYEFEVRARERFKVLIPLVFFIIFMLLYMTFHSASEA